MFILFTVPVWSFMFLRIPCFCASEIAVSPADCTLPEGFELWVLWVKNCDLIIIPGFTETQQQFVYVLGPAEANGKDSDQLIAQAWVYSLAAMFCFFCLLTVFLIASLQVNWPLEFLKPPPLTAAAKASMKRRREAMM